MAQEFKEVSNIRADRKKYSDSYDRIYGNVKQKSSEENFDGIFFDGNTYILESRYLELEKENKILREELTHLQVMTARPL
jgi:hypothetical protein